MRNGCARSDAGKFSCPGKPVCSAAENVGRLFLGDEGPDALERQLGLDLLWEALVATQDGVDEVAGVPKAHLEERRARLGNDRALEAAPTNEQPLVRPDGTHGAEQPSKDHHVYGQLLRLDLHANLRRTEAEFPSTSENVDATVGTW